MIINSLLDTDLYKFTMQQAVIAHFPEQVVRYELFFRSQRDVPTCFRALLQEEIDAMSALHIQPEEFDFLKKTCYYFKPPYLDFLRGYRFDPAEVQVIQEGNLLSLIIEGPWYRTILWEVPLMALISELFFRLTNQTTLPEAEITQRICNKAERLESIGAHFSDFGTRRRFSFMNHDHSVEVCKEYAPTAFNGTSNLRLAMVHRCKPIGTQAHEWYMCIASLYGYRMGNRIGMEKWVEVYHGDLGIALADTYTSQIFFNDFDSSYAKLFDGIRQDSGDPLQFVEMAVRHFEKLRIDSLSKTIVFSDNLDITTVEKIHNFCKGKIKDTYGIGTYLTNDVGVKPLNMVIKLTAVKINGDWVPAVKLSDDPGKHIGSTESINLCKQVLRIK